MKRLKKIISIAAALITIAIVVVLLMMIKGCRQDLRDDEEIDLQRLMKPGQRTTFVLPETEQTDLSAPQEVPETTDFVTKNPGQANDFSAATQTNSDIWAWLTIDDTNIDYPLVQADDNVYYLTRDAMRRKNKNGALFLDYRNNRDLSDFNSIVYGHHMKSGRMFQNLELFKTEAYFDSHLSGSLSTPAQTYELSIFAVAVTDPDSDYYNFVFISPSDREAHLAMIKDTAMFYRDIGVSEHDRILCLSTCSYEYSDARTVLLAKIVE